MSTEVTNNTVLVVDDQPDIRELLRYSLQMKGYEVAEAAMVGKPLSLRRDFDRD